MAKNIRRSEALWIEKENRWQVKVQKDGVRKAFHSSTQGRKGKHECEEKADNWLEGGSETDVRFAAAWAEYLENVKATTKDESYIKAESIGRNWMSDLDKKKLSAITPADFQKCINAAGQAGRVKRTCGNIRAQAYAFHKFYVSKRWPLQDPKPLTVPTDAPVGKRTILQPDGYFLMTVVTGLIQINFSKHGSGTGHTTAWLQPCTKSGTQLSASSNQTCPWLS
jgi:hypothetical protein